MNAEVTQACTAIELSKEYRVKKTTAGSIVVEEESLRGWFHKIFGLFLLVITPVFVGAFTLPLILSIMNGTNEPSSEPISIGLWCVVLLFFCVGLACAGLALWMACRCLIPWKVTVTVKPDYTLVQGGSMGRLLPTRCYSRPAQVVAYPAYHRGDWGFLLRLRFAEGKRTLLTPPLILGLSISKALAKGEKAAEAVARMLDVEWETAGWERYRQI